MENLKMELYKLLFSPIVTPNNLLDNIDLTNYEYVNYYKTNNCISCKLMCKLENGADAMFTYHFDREKRLDTIYRQLKDKEEELVFSRKIALSDAISFLENLSSQPLAI